MSDEAFKIPNYRSQRSKLDDALSADNAKVMFAGGTDFENESDIVTKRTFQLEEPKRGSRLEVYDLNKMLQHTMCGCGKERVSFVIDLYGKHHGLCHHCLGELGRKIIDGLM